MFAVVSSLSIPCVATLAALRGELGGRAALAICAASLALALGVGALLARLLGIA